MNILYRVVGAFLWCSYIGANIEISYNTAVTTNVWIYSVFVMLILFGIVGVCVILFAGRNIQ